MLERQVEAFELSLRKLEKQKEVQEKRVEDLQHQNNILIGKMEGEYCKLKIDLEVRTRETERLLFTNKTLADVGFYQTRCCIFSINHQECQSLRKAAETREADLQKVRGQMEENKANLTTRMIELKGEKKLLEHRLEHYLKLEDEVDKMVETQGDQETLLGSLPVCSARRTRQAVFLAQQVNDTRKEIKELGQKLKRAEQEKAALQIEVDRLSDLNRQFVREPGYRIIERGTPRTSGRGTWK